MDPLISPKSDERFRSQTEAQSTWIPSKKMTEKNYTNSCEMDESEKQFRRTFSAIELSANGSRASLPITQSQDMTIKLKGRKLKVNRIEKSEGSEDSDSASTTPRKRVFNSLKKKTLVRGRRKSIGTDPQSIVRKEEQELQEHENYHIIQKQKFMKEAMKKIKDEEQILIEDDGRDYGDAVFFVPNSKRFIIMANEVNYYQIRAATLNKLVERLTSLIPAFNEDC